MYVSLETRYNVQQIRKKNQQMLQHQLLRFIKNLRPYKKVCCKLKTVLNKKWHT